MMRIVTEDGTVLTLEQIQQAIMRITDSEELQFFGRPMPSLTDTDHPITVAKRIPDHLYREWAREQFEKRASSEDATYVNSWTVLGHDVVVFRDAKGLGVYRMPHCSWKSTDIIKSSLLRFGAVTANCEIKAMQRLSSHVKESQFDSYILSGIFVETSKRSRVKYFFRKGAPTLAYRWIGEGDTHGKCIAALCLHPMGYYEGTSCGCMAPTDEVIAHLLMMRADEHYFWRKANQHRVWDPRSGI
jgi:hypothetical protein